MPKNTGVANARLQIDQKIMDQLEKMSKHELMIYLGDGNVIRTDYIDYQQALTGTASPKGLTGQSEHDRLQANYEQDLNSFDTYYALRNAGARKRDINKERLLAQNLRTSLKALTEYEKQHPTTAGDTMAYENYAPKTQALAIIDENVKIPNDYKFELVRGNKVEKNTESTRVVKHSYKVVIVPEAEGFEFAQDIGEPNESEINEACKILVGKLFRAKLDAALDKGPVPLIRKQR